MSGTRSMYPQSIMGQPYDAMGKPHTDQAPEERDRLLLYYARSTYNVNWWRNVLLVCVLSVGIANLVVLATGG